MLNRSRTSDSFRRIARKLMCCAASIVALHLPAEAVAQSFPSKPVRIVVGFGPGGQADIIARIVAQKLGAQLSKPVIVENRPGAGGNIATEMVAKSPADGHTLLLVPSAFTVNPSLFKQVNYDPVKDFAPIAMLTTYPLYLVGSTAAPNTLQELIGAAKAQPGSINYASSGLGTAPHIAGELFASMAGLKLTHVPYKGGGPAVTGVAGGETHIHFGSSIVLPLVKSGKLNLLAVTSSKRLIDFPKVPTVAEIVPGFEIGGWNAMFAPAGTPPAIIKLLNAEVSKALRQPDTLEAVKKLDAELAVGTPEELGAVVKAESARWTKVIKELRITAD